jgi:hypothetical protein
MQTDKPRKTSITHDHVVWAYRLLLGREPESEGAIQAKLQTVRSIAELRTQILASPEFLQRNDLRESGTNSAIVIKELDIGRLFVDLSDFHIGLNIIKGVYEPNEVDYVRRTVTAGQTVIDIGANIGFYTITLGSLVGPNGHVYAFEPLSRNSSLLARSIAENDYQDRVSLEEAAVGEHAGEMQLISPVTTDNWGGPYLLASEGAIPLDTRSAVCRLYR